MLLRSTIPHQSNIKENKTSILAQVSNSMLLNSMWTTCYWIQCEVQLNKDNYKQLTVNVKQAAVLATDKPFLVNRSGPSFIIKYE